MLINKNGILAGVFLLFAITPASATDADPMSSTSGVLAKLSEVTGNRLFINGYFNAHYMDHSGVQRMVGRDLNTPIVQVREASLFFDIVPTNFITISGEAEFSIELSKDIATNRKRGVHAHVNFAYVNFDVNELFEIDTDTVGQININFGKFLIPFLGYNGDKANFRQGLMSQPFTAWQLAPVNNTAISFEHFGWTDVGVNLVWQKQIDSIGLIDAQISLINGLKSDEVTLDSNTIQLDTGGMMNPTVTPRDGLFGNRNHGWWFNEDNNRDKAIVSRVSFKPAAVPIEMGISYYSGAWDNAGDQKLSMYGIHTRYEVSRLYLKGEFAHAHVQEEQGLLITTAMGPVGLNTTTGDYNMYAWYIEGGVKVLQYGKGNAKYLRGILRYDEVDTNDRISFTPFDRSRITIGVEWEFLNQLRLRYEYQRSKLHDFANAPAPFVAAGGSEHVTMNMISLIGYF